ncbi:MAG: hypothetical protein ACLR2E_01765 [Lachnospiraceae bacterium]
MMVVIILAAYAFARLSFPGKNLLFTLFSLMMIPGGAGGHHKLRDR